MGDMGEYWRDVEEHFKDRARNPEKYFSKEEIAAYNERVKKRAQKRDEAKERIEALAQNLDIELKTYSNGQYSFGKHLDWWTTTGTAIERKSRTEHHISFADTQKLEKVLRNLLAT